MEYDPSGYLTNPDLRARLDQDGWNLTPSQAASTDYAHSITNITHSLQHRYPTNASEDGMSTQSRYSYRSDMDADRFFKRIGGRLFNALSDTYLFPSDDDEWVRLNKQHVAFFLALGELYPASEQVRAILAPTPGQKKRILDLGCGTGIWTMDMAREFPEAEVVGVDLAPIPVELDTTPSNCRFEVDDINLGLSHFRNSFDVVHIRLVGFGLQDFRKTMADVHQCLKPGGIALWADADLDIYAEDMYSRIPVALDEDEENPEQTERSWFQRMSNEIRRGLDVGRCDIHGMLAAMEEGLWEHDIMDPETCGTSSLYLPIGPWARGKSRTETDRLGYVGALMRQDFMRVHRASHAILARRGWDPTKLDKWAELVDKQLMDMSPKIWFRMQYAWGRRRTAKNGSAPPLPPLLPSSAESVHPYPHYYVYNTKAESQAAAALRARGRDSVRPAPPGSRRADAKQGEVANSISD